MRSRRTLETQMAIGLLMVAAVALFGAVRWATETNPDAWPWLTRLLAE